MFLIYDLGFRAVFQSFRSITGRFFQIPCTGPPEWSLSLFYLKITNFLQINMTTQSLTANHISYGGEWWKLGGWWGSHDSFDSHYL